MLEDKSEDEISRLNKSWATIYVFLLILGVNFIIILYEELSILYS